MYNWKKIKQDESFKSNFIKRSQAIKVIRAWFDNNNFLEVQTPKMVRLPGMEPNLTPVKAEFVSYTGDKQPAYLITSPEYAMKKLLCAGFEKIYEITPAWRNAEDNSPLHNTEFTMLEFYRPGDYYDLMKDVEQMVYKVNKDITGLDYIERDGKTIDLTTPWSRKSVRELFAQYLQLELFDLIENKPGFVESAKTKGYEVSLDDDWQDIFYKLFLTHIEPKLGWDQPVFVYDYPAAMAALSKLSKHDSRLAERVEFYIAGMELGNGFSELNDADEQLARLQRERKERQKLGMDDYEVDRSFIEALRVGMPDSTGIAIGIDRIIMLLLGKSSVEDVILFPQKDLFNIER